jgi:hypothetical protein
MLQLADAYCATIIAGALFTVRGARQLVAALDCIGSAAPAAEDMTREDISRPSAFVSRHTNIPGLAILHCPPEIIGNDAKTFDGCYYPFGKWKHPRDAATTFWIF